MTLAVLSQIMIGSTTKPPVPETSKSFSKGTYYFYDYLPNQTKTPI